MIHYQPGLRSEEKYPKPIQGIQPRPFNPGLVSLVAKLKWTIINQPNPYIRILLEKLRVTQLVKKFPAFYGTRRFLTKRVFENKVRRKIIQPKGRKAKEDCIMRSFIACTFH
jgi:hypothetical protein